MNSSNENAGRDYRETLILPKTTFPMKAQLPKNEPERLADWEKLDIYKTVRTARAGKKKFVLHDGPPYANGDLHMGTAMNKILKDLIVRSEIAMGNDAPYIPGWDCHGLPIEWKIEEQLRAEGKDKQTFSTKEIRTRCRQFAAHWIDEQRKQFKRLGGIGKWSNPYLTMDYRSEAIIASEFMQFNRQGLVYRGSKPVLWSVVEQTALAEAEVEYLEHTSHTIWVKYPVSGYAGDGQLSDHIRSGGRASVVIWTTTPWTIPSSMAICYGGKFDYSAYKVTAVGDDAVGGTQCGDVIIIADFCAPAAMRACKLELESLGKINPALLSGIKHPWHNLPQSRGHWDYPGENPIPMIDASHVTDDSGTGFVHTAPAHGADDYRVGVENQDRMHSRECYVQGDGTFDERIPLLSGATILDATGREGDANTRCIELLISCSALLGRGRLRHSYPHSWRSRAPLIFRSTPQWFIAVDKPFTLQNDELSSEGSNQLTQPASIRQRALHSIKHLVSWYPEAGRTRLYSMIKDRPDWVVSRQRAWGVPLTLFVSKRDGEVLNDPKIDARIVDAFHLEGADAWFDPSSAERFLSPEYNPNDYEQITDILDVWFDSGATHAYVMSSDQKDFPWDEDEVCWPASMYLEGSDQHRGWFHSSLLEGCGTRGRAPYESVLTHGFVLDERGRKMSKSLGNTVSPQDVLHKHGADIMRLWVASTDYATDMKIGGEILATHADTYRKLRNTFRFLLGNLAASKANGADILCAAALDQMPDLERYMIDRLNQVVSKVQVAYAQRDFKVAMATMINFAQNDLSSFYLDIRKDRLYCDDIHDPLRVSCVCVLRQILEQLSACLMPVICFTIDEVWCRWLEILGEDAEHATMNAHILEIDITAQSGMSNDDSERRVKRWDVIRGVRRTMTSAIESARAANLIGGSLECKVVVYVASSDIAQCLEGIDLAELAIVSQAELKICDSVDEIPSSAEIVAEAPAVAAEVIKLTGRRCARSWRYVSDVGSDPRYPDLSQRDAEVTALWDARHPTIG